VPKTLQIRDVPDDVHRTLRARAAAAGVSLSEYALAELTRVASYPPIADVLREPGLRRGGVPIDEIVRAIREGREERDV
jgi:antitoxin FitA